MESDIRQILISHTSASLLPVFLYRLSYYTEKGAATRKLLRQPSIHVFARDVLLFYNEQAKSQSGDENEVALILCSDKIEYLHTFGRS